MGIIWNKIPNSDFYSITLNRMAMSVLEESELQRLYESSKHQSSDLVFFDDEAKFFKSLLNRYFHSNLMATHVNRVQLINSQLMQLKLVKANITSDSLRHQGNLQMKIKNLFSKSLDFLELENNRIEDEIKDLNKSLKNIKKGVFTIYKNLETENWFKPVR